MYVFCIHMVYMNTTVNAIFQALFVNGFCRVKPKILGYQKTLIYLLVSLSISFYLYLLIIKLYSCYDRFKPAQKLDQNGQQVFVKHDINTSFHMHDHIWLSLGRASETIGKSSNKSIPSNNNHNNNYLNPMQYYKLYQHFSQAQKEKLTHHIFHQIKTIVICQTEVVH